MLCGAIMPDLVFTITHIVKKAHSLYACLRPVLLREVHWKKGDTLIALAVDGDVILRKMRADEIADAARGALLRRREPVRRIKVDGSWDWKDRPKVEE